MLSFQREASKLHFLIRPNSGTIARATKAQQKFTPRFTPCSTFTLTATGSCHFSQVPSILSVYLPAGSDDKIASFDYEPSVHAPSLSDPL